MRDGGRVFYGWYIVAACFVIAFVVFGISVNTFTVYVKPIEAEFGWPRAKISLGMTIGALAMGASAPFVGRLIDRMGASLVMAIGGTVVGAASILVSRAQSLPFFYSMYALSGIGQAGATLIPISLVISNWFSAKRGRALGIVMTGTGLGAMFMVPVTSWIVVNYNWRTSYLIMGCAIILISVPINLLVIRSRPADMGLQPDGGIIQSGSLEKVEGLTVVEAFRTLTFWLITVMMLLFGLIAMGVGVHMMPYLTDIGHTETMAGLIIAIISLMTVVGKLGIGFVADKWGIRQTVILTCGMILVGIVLLMEAEVLAVACVFAVIYGFAIGAPLVINPALTAQCLGLAHFGSIFGMLTLFNTLGAAIGAVLTGAIYDGAKSYTPAFIAFIALTVIAALCGVSARRKSAA